MRLADDDDRDALAKTCASGSVRLQYYVSAAMSFAVEEAGKREPWFLGVVFQMSIRGQCDVVNASRTTNAETKQDKTKGGYAGDDEQYEGAAMSRLYTSYSSLSHAIGTLGSR